MEPRRLLTRALGIIAVTTLTRMTMVAIRHLKGHKIPTFFH